MKLIENEELPPASILLQGTGSRDRVWTRRRLSRGEGETPELARALLGTRLSSAWHTSVTHTADAMIPSQKTQLRLREAPGRAQGHRAGVSQRWAKPPAVRPLQLLPRQARCPLLSHRLLSLGHYGAPFLPRILLPTPRLC